MKLYSIGELEQLSGIKAGTIRIWEKRFGIIEPWRTDTNFRMYDEGQVRKLMNVATLLADGRKISYIASISDKVLHREVVAIHELSCDAVSISFINRLISAAVSLNEQLFHETFNAAVEYYGMYESVLRVCYPFLHKLGIMWVTETAVPVQEHFATALVRRRLLYATEQLPVKKTGKKLFVLLLPPGEWHEIGLLFADYLIRSRGMNTIYLGQNVPYENVAAVVTEMRVSHVLLFFITPAGNNATTAVRDQMGLAGDATLLLAGNPSVTARIESHKNTFILNDPGQLLPFLD